MLYKVDRLIVAAAATLCKPNILLVLRNCGMADDSVSERRALYRELLKHGIETQELDQLSNSSLKQLVAAIKAAYAEYDKSRNVN